MADKMQAYEYITGTHSRQSGEWGYMNSMGQEGWQLCCVIHDWRYETTENDVYYWKRPIQDTGKKEE